MITPEQLAASGSEHGAQAALFMWAQLNLDKYPLLKFLHHIPNGGYRDKITAGKLKAAGVKEGVPDICLPVRIYVPNRVVASGLYIELKVKKNKPSDAQKEWGQFLISQGYYFYVAYGWEDAKNCILNYLEGKREV